jgi:hypothetical protein
MVALITYPYYDIAYFAYTYYHYKCGKRLLKTYKLTFFSGYLFIYIPEYVIKCNRGNYGVLWWSAITNNLIHKGLSSVKF